jgi:hypothetical protein
MRSNHTLISEGIVRVFLPPAGMLEGYTIWITTRVLADARSAHRRDCEGNMICPCTSQTSGVPFQADCCDAARDRARSYNPAGGDLPAYLPTCMCTAGGMIIPGVLQPAWPSATVAAASITPITTHPMAGDAVLPPPPKLGARAQPVQAGLSFGFLGHTSQKLYQSRMCT